MRKTKFKTHHLKAERELRGWSRNYVAEQVGSDINTVGRWERGERFPNPYFRQQLCQLFGKNAQELELMQESANNRSEEHLHSLLNEPNNPDALPTASLPLWNVPYRRNPLFTGREDVLNRLHTLFGSSSTVTLTQSQAISGLGGIGKTQIALEYAYRYRDEYQAVLWARAETQNVLMSDFVSIAEALNLPEKSGQDQSHIIEAVKLWLAAHTNWLLILDNVEDFLMVDDFLPRNSKGHILFTTRAQSTGTFAQRIDLEQMEPNEGTLFLLRRTKLLESNALLEGTPEALSTSAKDIVQILDGLPLALDQAGAYIEETACSLSDYLDRYQQRRAMLLDRRGEDSKNHPQSVSATLSLSFERVDKSNSTATDLLRLCAFLYPDAIPEEMITEAAPVLGPVLHSVAADPLQLDMAIAALRAYSLVHRNPETKMLTIHRLVQAVLKDQMNKAMQRQWAERAVQAVNRMFPDDEEVAVWQSGQRYLPHAQVCASLIEQWDIVSVEAGRLLNQAACYLQEHAQYAQAELFFKKALDIRMQVLGMEHRDVADNLNNLALIYRDQGKYAQAELLHQQTLNIRIQMLGPEHPDVAETLNNLAELYRDQGKYSQAEPLYLQALAICEQEEEPEQLKIATALNNLALLFIEQGRYTQAEPLHQRVLTILKEMLGPEHPKVATSLSNLAVLYKEQGNYAQAEPLFLQALAIRQKRLEPEHPDMATILNNLAVLYREQGKYAQAEPLFLRALGIREKMLGPEHPRTAQSLNDLARLYHVRGNYAQAEVLYLRAFNIRDKVLGPEHPSVAESLNDLARLYHAQRNYAQAEPLYQRALTIRRQSLSTEHPDVIATAESYAKLLRETNREAEAVLMHLQI